MNDPNLEPVKLIEFDADTLSTVSALTMLHVRLLQRSNAADPIVDKLLQFNTQLLNACSRVLESEKVMNQ